MKGPSQTLKGQVDFLALDDISVLIILYNYTQLCILHYINMAYLKAAGVFLEVCQPGPSKPGPCWVLREANIDPVVGPNWGMDVLKRKPFSRRLEMTCERWNSKKYRHVGN